MRRRFIISWELHAEEHYYRSGDACRAICRGFQKGFARGVGVRAYREEQSTTDSRRALREGTGGTARAVNWEQTATDSRIVLRGGAGTDELLRESNLPRIPEGFCAGIRQKSCRTILLLS